MSDPVSPIFRLFSGRFCRAVLAERVHAVLDPPSPESGDRYHRYCQPALYMSPEPEWAMRAVSGYMREDGKARMLVPLLVTEAMVLDQHDEAICEGLGIDRTCFLASCAGGRRRTAIVEDIRYRKSIGGRRTHQSVAQHTGRLASRSVSLE